MTLTRARERNLFLVCANPDIVVERGERANPDAASVANLLKAASKPPFAVTSKLMW